MATPTTLYRFYDQNDQLLYVGIATSPGRRFREHASDKEWWARVATVRLEHFPDRKSAAEAELADISTRRPIWNIIGKAISDKERRAEARAHLRCEWCRAPLDAGRADSSYCVKYSASGKFTSPCRQAAYRERKKTEGR